MKSPKGERVWISYYNTKHELRYIITSKEASREYYFLYELTDGTFKKLGKAQTPIDLERKFNISEKTRC